MKLFITIFLILFLNIKLAYSFEIKVKQAILMDYETGEILYLKNADAKVYPSSMTKIMTAYLIFEKLNTGKINLLDKIQISQKSWEQKGSRMFLNINSNVTIDELLKGLIVQSGNDAAFALAEGATGSVEQFIKEMNQKAKDFELQNTNFTNPIGFSDIGHYMSVRDTAIISKNLIRDFPQYYIKYFSLSEYKYNNIPQLNRNRLLGKYENADGIKTGHTEAGGYSLSASAVKNNRRLISVVNGSSSENERTEESRKLLDYGFLTLTKYILYEKDEIIKQIPVIYGKEKFVNAIVKNTLTATAKDKKEIKIEIKLPKILKAPIIKNQKIGFIVLTTETDQRTFDLYAENEIQQVNIFKRFFLKIYYFFANILK